MKAASIYVWLWSAFLLLALAPLLGAGWYFLHTYENALRQTVASNLAQIANKKYDQIDSYLQERYADVHLLSNRPSIKHAIADFSGLWQQQGPQSASYQQLIDSMDDSMLPFLEAGNYYDLLLIDTAGNVLYSIAREPDLGSNLFNGPYRTSKLAEGVELVLTLLQTNQTMFAPYEPSRERYASFLTAPVLDDGLLIGAVVLQLNWDRLQSVVTDRTGLGVSGETVLAQRDSGEVLYTGPLLHIENAAFRYRVSLDSAPEPMRNVLNGQSGYGIIIKDYVGHPVVAAWRYLPALHWGMIVKIDASEAFAPLERMQRVTFSVLGVLACLLSLLAYHFGNTLSKPLQSLMQATKHMARRDFRMKAQSAGPRELRELADSFNKMSGDLANLYLNLEIKVRERDQEIEARKSAESALIEARDAAQAANRAKSVFLANMSHELRTPMNAILGFAQIMERDASLSPEHRRHLGTINRSGSHLLALINDVLEISRIEAGRTQLQNEVFSLTELLAVVKDMIRVRAELKGLRFNCVYRDDIPDYVTGDQNHLRQILLNLLGNAVKYTEQGSITLSLQKKPGGIRFEVTDSGVGISAEDLPRIFQAFYQTDASAKKGEGAGLGLSITQEFVRLMGGEISVNSQPGKGSSFVFSIPLPEADAPPMAAPPRRIIGLAQAPIRVLVAEDNRDNRELINLMLTGIGLEVRLVENGQQAIEQFQAWQPQFIWMDMRMPVLDGYQATKAIRALPGGKQVKIVALTASAFREDTNVILRAGCDQVLSKPVDEQRLFQVMGNLLGLHYRYAEHSEPATEQEALRPNDALDLSPLSAELRAELTHAAELLDTETVASIIERIRPGHPEIAKALTIWARVYRFDVIIKLCRTANKGPAE